MIRTRRQHAIVVAVIAAVAVIFGAGFAAMQTVLRGGLSVGAAISLRFGLGTVGLWLLLKLNGARFDRRSVNDGLILGLLLVAIFWLQTDGLRFTTSSKSGLITSLYVPFTPLLAFFLRDRVKLSHALGALIATFGLYLLVRGPGDSAWSGWNRGDLETLACAVICTFHVTFTARASRRSNAWVLAFIQVAVTAGISAVITAFLPAPNGFQATPAAFHDARVLVALGVMAFLVTVFGFWGMSAMQAYLSATEAAVIYSLEPVVATIIGVVWMGEHFRSLQLLGAVLIVAAMLTSELLPRMLARIRPEELAEAD
ncbi:MAG TPA: DMT family transporter [Terriglobales bacterium]|nr:DMT family transporter [Terriglobales bacterium]